MESNLPSDPPRGASPFPVVPGDLDRALAIVEFLREHCAWDRKQTTESLVPYLLEETHETIDAIRSGDSSALREELGDLLLNLAFQIIVAEQEGRFTRAEVVAELEEKMIRRHPHLFGGPAEGWEEIKARERQEKRGKGSDNGEGGRDATSGSHLDGLAAGLDTLLRAQRIQERVAGVGFDWDDASGALEKVREELEEVVGAGANQAELEEEMGDLLFAVVNFARLSGMNAVRALEAANAKFQRRFRALEALAQKRGVPLPGAGLPELDILWDEVKRLERE